MTVRTVTHDVSLVSGSTSDVLAALSPLDYTWTHDEGAAPYTTAELTMVAPPLALYAKLAPSQGNAVLVATSVDTQGDAGAYVMLKVQSLDRNDDGTITLGLVSGEQRLIDYSPSAVDRTTWGLQASVRSIVEYVLTAALGGASAWTMPALGGATGVDPGVLAFPTYQAATNLANNPRLGVDATGWQAVGSGGTLSRGTNANAAYPFQNYTRLGIGSGATSATGIAYVQAAQFSAGQRYTFSFYGQVSKSGGNQMSGRLIWFDATGNEVGARGYAATRATTSNWSQRFVITATAPVGAASFSLTFYGGTGASSWASGDVLYATAVLVTEGNGLDTDGVSTMPYFDGDTTAGTGGYSYAWQDTASGSPSTRTPIADRDPDVLTWSPGQSAWDFLSPILEATGTRLFSLGYVAGVGSPAGIFAWVTNRYAGDSTAMRFVQGSSLYELTQREARDDTFPDGTPMFADAVVITYTWRDSAGQDHTAYDAYPTAGYSKPWNLELDEPFPGAGRARGLFLRLRARATVLAVSGPFTPTLQAGAQLIITDDRLGGSSITYADAVTHRPMDGVTEVRTKQTISFPNNAWLTKTTPWSALTGTWAAQ